MGITEEQILEGNKIISEFLGIEWHSNGTVSRYLTVFNMKMGEDTINDLKFHISWDWIMLVCKKIQKMYIRNEMSNTILRQNLRDAIVSIDLGMVWLAVVDCIKWFNQQSK